MKNFLLTLVCAGVACVAAFAACYHFCTDRELQAAAREGDAMAWLRTEFRLDDAQFAAVKKIHDDYSIACSEHCAAIMAARERRAPAPEVAALEKTCVDAMTAHFRRVAALMSPGEGERYLAVVLPRVAGYSHEGAPNLRATP